MKKFFNFGKNRKESSDSSRSNRGSVVSRNGSVVSLSSVTQATAGGYDVREKDLGKLHKAVLQGDIAKIQSLVRKENINGFDKQKRTALHFACAIGSADAVKELLSWKANVNLGDNEAKTPLIKAVECNHPECTTLLLNAKADPKTKDKEGNTVLHYAARFGYHDVMTLLLDVLDKGREEDLQYLNVKNNNGLSPLHIAVHNHQNITCSDLLEHDVDVNVVDKKGNTPLMIACELGHTDLVDMLLEYDADSSKKNLEGWTAEDIAQRKGNEQCSKRIAEYQSQPPGSTPRVATSVQAAGDDEDDDDDNEDAGANANKGQQAAGGDETDSWQDSDSEQPTVHSQQLKKNLSLNSPRQDDSAVNNLAYTIGDISAELDEPQANKSQAGPLNNLSHANVRHDIDPGYETVKVAGNSQKPSIHSLDNDEKTPSIPFLASSLGASGDHDNFTDQVQIPQSARSTLTGRSWLSDSKWSDEEDDNEDSLVGPAFVNPGAIPKTSASANMLLNNNNNNNATKAPKTTNLSAANAMAELNKNDNNNQPNGVNSKKKVDNNQLSVDDMGLEDVDSFNDNSALKPLDSARSNASDWDSSISDGVGIGAGARGIMANKGDLTGSNIAASVGKPMAQINEKSESDSKWDSDDDDIQEIPTIPSVAPPPVSAVVNMKEPIYSSVQKTSFHSKPPPVPPPPVPQFNVLEMDEAELVESRHNEVAVDAFDEDTLSPVQPDSSEVEELHPVPSRENVGRAVTNGRMQNMQCKKTSTGEEEHEDENSIVNGSTGLGLKNSFANAEFGYFTKTVVKVLPDGSIENEALDDDFGDCLSRDSGGRSRNSSLSEVAEDEDLQVIGSHSANSIVAALDLGVALESRDEVGVERTKRGMSVTSVDDVEMVRRNEVVDSIVVQNNSEGACKQSLPDHDSNRETMSELKRTTSPSPDEGVPILSTPSNDVDSQPRYSMQKASSKVDNISNDFEIEDDEDDDGKEQEKSLQLQSAALSDFDLSYRLSVGHKSSAWPGSVSVSHDNVINKTEDMCSKTAAAAAAAAAAVSFGQVTTHIAETVDSKNSVGAVSSVSGTVIIEKKSSLLTSMKTSTVELSTESHVDVSSTVSHSSISISQQNNSEQVFPAAISDESIESYHKKSESDEEEESTWETDRKAAKHSQSELTNAGTSKPKMEKSKILTSDRNPSPAPSTQSLHGDPVSLDANLNNVMRLQDHLRETQKKLDDTRNQLLSFEHKCKALEEDRSQLQQKLDNISRERMALEQTKIDLEAKLRNLEYKLSEEQRRKENAELLCEKIKDQASHKEEHIKKLMETNQKLEVQHADARKGHVKELDELKALSSSSQEPELYAVQLQLERAKELHKDEIDRLQYEIDELKKEKAELEFKFNCGEDALTHSKLSSSMELNAVKLEADRLMTGFTKEKEDRDKLDAMVSSLRSQLSSVEADLRTEQSSKKELERQMQHQTDQWRRSLEQREDELMRSQTTVQNQSVQLADLLGKITELESKLQITNANLTERMNQLSNVQRNLDEKRASYETLDDNWRKEKETNIRLTAKVESLEEKLTDAVQEVQRLKSNADPGKVSTDKLTSLLNDMKEDRDKTKLEMQQKNSLLTEAVNQAKADLRSVERDKASLEDEKRRMQTQLTNLQHQLTSTETSIESGNQQRQQLMAESQQLNRQIDVLKERLEEERRRASSAEAKLSGVTDKLKNSEKIVSTTADRLNQESSSLLSISKSKRELEESLHRMELEKTKLEVSLDAERQKVTLLQREYNDAKLAQKTIVDDFSKIKASNAQLQCLMNEAAGLRQQATQEADDNRALWESEIKSRSKLGLRIAQLEREKQEVLNHLNEEKRKARKAMEGKRTMETKLSQEEQRSSQMEKEIITLRTHLKNAKKRMKAVEVQMTLDRVSYELDDARQRIQQDIGETGHFMFASSPDPMLYSMPSGVNDGLRQGSVDGLHHAGVNGHFASDSLKTYQLQMNLPGNYMERPDLQKLKAELEAKAQKELDDKLEEVNAYLIEQTKARERLDRIRDTNEMEIRKEFDRMKKDLLDEVVRLKSGVQRDNIVHNKDAINRHTKESEQQMRELYESEQRLRQLLTSRLDHAMDKASRTPTFADQRHAFENDGSLDESIRMQLNQSISRHLDVITTPFARNVSPSNVGETGGVDYSPPLQLSHLA